MISSAYLRKGAVAASLLVLAGGSLAACADDLGPQNYGPYAAGSVARVDEGVTVDARPIHFNGYDNGAGTIGGGVAGAVVGSQFGGRYDHGTFGVLGAIGGAVIGHEIAKGAGSQDGFVYTVRLRRDGRLIQVAQADRYPIPQGTRVFVSYGDRVRLQPITAPPPPPPGYYAPPPRY